MNNYSNYPFFYEKYKNYDLSLNNNKRLFDMEYLVGLYPSEINELKNLVKNECDSMEYTGSLLYDEYPDKIMFMKKCNEICSIAECTCKYAKKCPEPKVLKDIITILLSDEFYRRRQKKKFY